MGDEAAPRKGALQPRAREQQGAHIAPAYTRRTVRSGDGLCGHWGSVLPSSHYAPPIPTTHRPIPSPHPPQVSGALADPHPGARSCSPVQKFWQKASVEELTAAGAVRPDGTVLIDSGVIYFSPSATQRLSELARSHPLNCCTYLGLDMSRKPLRIELYSGEAACMCLRIGRAAEHCPASAPPPSRLLGAHGSLFLS